MFIPITNAKYEVIVDKSKFLAYLICINNEQDIADALVHLKDEHPKARHILYAYKLGIKSKSNDDNEPGSIAKGFIELINKYNLDKCLLIVVRYFGGVKLGASRLLRTYLSTANEVIKLTSLGEEKEVYKYNLIVDYPTFNKLKNAGYFIENVSYFDKIKLELISKIDLEDEFKKLKISSYQVSKITKLIK